MLTPTVDLRVRRVDMPVTVAVDAGGTSVHITGPAEWQKRIASGGFKSITLQAA